MKTITRFLLGFALTISVLTITFRYFLSYGIDNKSTIIVVLSAILYFIGMFISGWFFGKKDGDYLPIYDVGFRFHFTTFFIFNLISELWFVFGFNSGYEKVRYVHLTAIIWGVFLLFHFVMYLKAKRKSIDNLDKEELFD